MTTPQKTVFVAGGTRGIGLALVEVYKQNGWKVIASARNLDTADELKALSPNKIVQLDTSDEASILQAAKELEGEPIDLLINNAGIANSDTIATATKASMVQHFEVNAVGPFLMTRALLPNLRAAVATHGSAVVGNVSSFMSIIAYNDSGEYYAYRASKTALNMINSDLAINLKKDKITAVVLHPGLVATALTGHDGDIQPAESAAGLSKVLAELKEEDAGKFFSFEGVALPW
jgi:NAD(P)-dependent dehydrogenase (short-subunit alcohol dehydrogenase family)